MLKKQGFYRMLSLLLALLLLVGCQATELSDPNASTSAPNTALDPNGTADAQVQMLNGVPLSEYTVIYNAKDLDYSQRAAVYIQEAILEKTGVSLAIKEDGEGSFAHEIVVGETDRAISKQLDADTQKTQFAILADESSIALEGKYFVIAAAAYFFVETYIPSTYFQSTVPKEVCIHDPIQKEAKNYILLIGDGMGLYQTLLFDLLEVPTSGTRAYGDGEDLFYGYMMQARGFAKTDSLSGVTDSAAAGTALASGYKTKNGFIGKNGDGRNVQSLTELAASLDMATAVMSTEVVTGATPSAFSAHAPHRNDTDLILSSQALLKSNSGTIIQGDFDYYDTQKVKLLEKAVSETLETLSKNENGFFMMYEEAYIDKHCHSNNLTKAFYAMIRFNQTIGLMMEYAFYNPDTFLLITADHETGGMYPDGMGNLAFRDGNHTAQYVPIFAYGKGAELFDGRVIENTQIPKTIAAFWGVEGFGADDGLLSLQMEP